MSHTLNYFLNTNYVRIYTFVYEQNELVLPERLPPPTYYRRPCYFTFFIVKTNIILICYKQIDYRELCMGQMC